MTEIECIHPDWSVPDQINACVTTRVGGVSQPPFDSLNLGLHVNDSIEHVQKNRILLNEQLALPSTPVWLNQVHGVEVADAAFCSELVDADAAFTNRSGVVCAVMTADCLPVFFAAKDGSEVAIAHAGWRGLANGVLQSTIAAMESSPDALQVWLGPAIGSDVFEVGAEVRDAFIQQDATMEAAFKQISNITWMADIYALARCILSGAGIEGSGGGFCTYTDSERFFSYRRDGRTGRMASLIWIDS